MLQTGSRRLLGTVQKALGEPTLVSLSCAGFQHLPRKVQKAFGELILVSLSSQNSLQNQGCLASLEGYSLRKWIDR